MIVTQNHDEQDGPLDWTRAPRSAPLGQPAAPVSPQAQQFTMRNDEAAYTPAPGQPQFYPAPPQLTQGYYPQVTYVQKLPRAGTATAALVCGLIGLFLWCLFGLPNILAVVFGHLAYREIKQAGRDPRTGQDYLRGRLMAGWGLLLGYPGAIIGILTAVNYVTHWIK